LEKLRQRSLRQQLKTRSITLNSTICPFVVPLDHVDAVDADAVDRDLELQHRIALRLQLAHVAEPLVEEHLERRQEIHRRERLADLRRMRDPRMECRRITHQIAGSVRGVTSSAKRRAVLETSPITPL
jgi:hypothetical protein